MDIMDRNPLPKEVVLHQKFSSQGESKIRYIVVKTRNTFTVTIGQLLTLEEVQELLIDRFVDVTVDG